MQYDHSDRELDLFLSQCLVEWIAQNLGDPDVLATESSLEELRAYLAALPEASGERLEECIDAILQPVSLLFVLTNERDYRLPGSLKDYFLHLYKRRLRLHQARVYSRADTDGTVETRGKE